MKKLAIFATAALFLSAGNTHAFGPEDLFCNDGKFSLDKTAASLIAWMGTASSIGAALTLSRLNVYTNPNGPNKTLDREKYSDVYDTVEKLSIKMNIPAPQLLYNPHPMANMLTVGMSTSNSAIILFDGILKLLSKEELYAIIGHELAHIQQRHIAKRLATNAASFIATYAAHQLRWQRVKTDTLKNRICGVGTWVGVPTILMLCSKKIVRNQELAADRIAAEATGTPLALASAIQKLNGGLNPTPGLQTLLADHPSTDIRVGYLQAMATELEPSSNS